MKINWKVRIKNKLFWLAFIPAVLTLIRAVAAISELPVHAAIMFTSDGVPVTNQKYVHAIPQVEPEPEEDTPTDGE